MVPIRLKLRGFTGVRAAMGRDEIELDLGDARQGLVAICGYNGSGKSTLLDNLHPYRTMPSRVSGDAYGSFSYYEHLCLPDALKELEFEHDGQRYRSQLVFRMNGKRKTEAYLHVWQAAAWVPAQLQDGTRSDGKTDTYDACIEGLLGSAETFFTSVFSAQSKRSLSDLRNSEIKELLSDLLGLAAIADAGQKAAEVSRLLKPCLASERSALSAAEEDVRGAQHQLAKLGSVDVELSRATGARRAAIDAVDAARTELAKREGALSASASVEAQRERLSQEKRRIEKDARARADGFGASRRSLEQRIVRARQAGTARKEAAAHRLKALAGEREDLEAVVSAGPAIARARRRKGDAAAVAAARRERSDALGQVQAKHVAVKAGKEAAGARLVALEREAGKASLQVADLKRRLGLTDSVPCRGMELQGRCDLLGDAHQAQTLMPSAEADVGRLARERQALRAEMSQAADTVAGLERQLAQWPRAKEQARAAEARCRYFESMLASEPEVERARVRLAAVAAELQVATTQSGVHGLSPDEEAEIEAAQRELTDLEARSVAAEMEDAEALKGVEAALQALPAPADRSSLDQARAVLNEAEKAAREAENGYTQAVRHQEAAAQLGAGMLAAEMKVRSAQERVARLQDEANAWALVAKGLSNDGVIALSIDDAGPTLAALTNDLLVACYGTRFTVTLQTQVETAKGERREGFDIVVHDATNDESKSVSVMSGGERVWINECMTRAIALYLAQNAGRRYGALFSDEADGPLDPDRKRMFMAMKREVLRLGGYAVEYFVSQTPELNAMADTVIEVERYREAGAA